MAQATAINPAVLRWARESAGLSLEDAAARIKLRDTRKQTAAERLSSWERGTAFPTQNQLAAIAKAYQRPLTTFFLSAPPKQDKPMTDFRRVADKESISYSIELTTLIRLTRARQEDVRALLLDDEDFQPFGFVGSAKRLKSAKSIADRIRQDLKITLEAQRNSKGELFSLIREAAESAGIFVQLAGDLGSHHSAIPVEQFRGFVIADDVAPWIVLNPSDSKYAYTFTLVHELAHLWLGFEGVSNVNPFATEDEAVDVERRCNEVAAEFLLPKNFFLDSWAEVENLDIRTAVTALKNDYGVSHTAAACRLWKLGLISDTTWWELFNEYRTQWLAHKSSQKQSKRGPNYYTVRQHRLGKPLIRLITNAVDEQELSMVRAGRILGVNPLGLNSLREAAGD